MTRIGRTIRDKRILGLTGKYLRAGVMINGVVQDSEEGTPPKAGRFLRCWPTFICTRWTRNSKSAGWRSASRR